jgi:hypothetical protein
LVRELFAGKPKFVEKSGREREMDANDILIVVPYNVQVNALREDTCVPPSGRDR